MREAEADGQCVMEHIIGQCFYRKLYCVGCNLVCLPGDLDCSVVAEYLVAWRYHHALAGIVIEISKGMEGERRRELPGFIEGKLGCFLMWLHLHDSRRLPVAPITTFAPNSHFLVFF